MIFNNPRSKRNNNNIVTQRSTEYQFLFYFYHKILLHKMQQSTNVINDEVGKQWEFWLITLEHTETIISVWQFFEKEKAQQQHIYVRRPVQTIRNGDLDQPWIRFGTAIGDHGSTQLRRLDDGHEWFQLLVDITTKSIMCLRHETFQLHRNMFE